MALHLASHRREWLASSSAVGATHSTDGCRYCSMLLPLAGCTGSDAEEAAAVGADRDCRHVQEAQRSVLESEHNHRDTTNGPTVVGSFTLHVVLAPWQRSLMVGGSAVRLWKTDHRGKLVSIPMSAADFMVLSSTRADLEEVLALQVISC